MSIKLNNYSKHSYFMKLALMQAHKNLGNTKDNPSVGCVIVKNDIITSAECTGINGRPHAEKKAITYSKENLKNSNLYVTLEPCSHYGLTPPCVNAIIKKKIKKVFFSVMDPDYRSYNKSEKKLLQNNIKVKKGILLSDTKIFYKSYLKYKSKGLPYVAGKMAVSKDFFTKNIKNKWITNKFSRGRVHLMRSCHDCILTSVKTIIYDDPKLTCRILGLEKNSPSRIILDKELKIPINSYIVNSAKEYPTIIFFNKVNKKKIKILKSLNVKLVKTHLINNDNFDLKDILTKIKMMGFSRIFLETGLDLTTNFLKNKLIDDFYLFISSDILGKNGRKNFKKNMNMLFKKKNYIKEKVNLFGDKLISYRLK